MEAKDAKQVSAPISLCDIHTHIQNIYMAPFQKDHIHSAKLKKYAKKERAKQLTINKQGTDMI